MKTKSRFDRISVTTAYIALYGTGIALVELIKPKSSSGTVTTHRWAFMLVCLQQQKRGASDSIDQWPINMGTQNILETMRGGAEHDEYYV